MIVSIRGSNGSGKSTLVRRIVDLVPRSCEIAYPEDMNKKKPMAQILFPSEIRRIFVPGHYAIRNGGIDTMDLNYAYDVILKAHEDGADVLYEGHNYRDGAARLLLLRERGLDVRTVLLTTNLQECIASVRARGHGICDETITKIYLRCLRDNDKFAAAGIPAEKLDRDAALARVREWLEL